MANRSYLFASNRLPHEGCVPGQRNTTGISEWNHHIPLIHKILVSGNPRIVESCIWPEAGHIAIVGEFSAGVVRLRQFLDRITLAEAHALKQQAFDFLAGNRRTHFILECGEIYDMGDDDLEEQNKQLFEELTDLGPQIELAVADLMPQAATQILQDKEGWLTRLFGRTRPPAPLAAGQENPLDQLNSLGLGNWSNVLYFDLQET